MQRSPVALIVAGSGPTDRDGNSPPSLDSAAYRKLAAALSDMGIASLRYDKRGVAASARAASSEADLRFEDYVGDAAAWLAWLKADPRFTSTILVGHSEGSLVGMLVGVGLGRPD